MCLKGMFRHCLGLYAWHINLPKVFAKQSLQAWVFAHIQLIPEEVAKYKNIPVVYDGEYGFFFEPNE